MSLEIDKENSDPTQSLEARVKASTVSATEATHLRTQVEQLRSQKTKLTRDANTDQEQLATKRSEGLATGSAALQSQIAAHKEEQPIRSQRETTTRAGDPASRDPVSNPAARLQQLEKKLDQLQRVHDDGKKAHEKKLAEQAEAHLHSKRQLESQLHDAKKQISTLQTDIRQMRSKVTETDRAESIRAKERQKRDEAEAKLKDARSASETALSQAKKQIAQLTADLEMAAAQAGAKELELRDAKELADARLASLHAVAQQFGRMAKTTVSKGQHETLSTTVAAHKLRIVRLERKLADRDAQNQELVQLARSMESDRRSILATLDASKRALFWERSLNEQHDLDIARWKDASKSQSNEFPVAEWQLGDLQERQQQQEFELQSAKSDLALADERRSQAHTVGLTLLSLVEQQQVTLAGHDATLESLAAQRSDLQAERDTAVSKIADLEKRTRHAELEEVHWKTATSEAEKRVQAESSKWEGVLSAEKSNAKKLLAAIQQGKLREQLLEADVDTLRKSLDDVTAYEQLYEELAHEMRGLVARGSLAEAEAERLSKFNAEILSHTNPQQKIMYLDRIRRQLADTQQQLILCSRDKDELESVNAALEHELELYKSVRRDTSKARSGLTRVGRLPTLDEPDAAGH